MGKHIMGNQRVRMAGAVSIFLLISAFILLNGAFWNHILLNPVIEQSGEEYIEREEYLFSDILEDEQDYIEQKFCAQRTGMHDIKIRLAINHADLKDDITLSIELCQEDKILQQEEVTREQIKNWTYYHFRIEEKIRPGQEYSIRIRQLTGPESEDSDKYWISYSIFHAVEHVAENASYYLYNGDPVDGEFEVCYVYDYVDQASILRLFLADALFVIGLSAVFVLGKYVRRFESIKKCVAAVLYFGLPVAAFLAVEFVAGNLRTLDGWSIIKNLFVYYLIFIVLSFVCRSVGLLAAAYLFICMAWGLIQYFVLSFRGRAFSIQDILAWKTAATVAGQYKYEVTFPIFVCLLIILFLVFLCGQIRTSPFSALQKTVFAGGILCIMGLTRVVCGSYLISTYAMNVWDQEANHKKYGTVLTFLSELQYLIVEEPEGYSVRIVGDILDEMREMLSEEQEKKTIPDNIIFIMNESFADLEYIGEINADTELLPYLHGMNENVVKGWTSVPSFGAGTASSEYEALTGNTMAYLVAGSTAYQTNVFEGECSLVSTLKTQGYRTVAMHPYQPGNWNRTTAYSRMGFDEFLSEDNWGSEMEMIRWCASDRAAYDKVIELCEQTEGKLFAFLVTMQNHGGYAAEWDNFQNTVELDYEEQYPQAEQYLSLLQESDRAFGELVEYFRGVKESAMIVMFGDHQAQIEQEFYENIFGKPLSELSFEEMQGRYITPFVIWTNYDLEEEYDVRMSTNYLGSYILRAAGLNLAPYNQFLLELWDNFPVICIRGVCDKEGMWYRWSELPEDYAWLLREYEILQYNAVYDRKNRVDEFFMVE